MKTVKQITEIYQINDLNQEIKLSHIPLKKYMVKFSKQITPDAIDFENGTLKIHELYPNGYYITYWYEEDDEGDNYNFTAGG